jgi:hypothetical protein
VLVTLLAGLTLLPRVDARAEAAQELGLESRLRGEVQVAFDAVAVAGDAWRLSIFTGVRTWIRPNDDDEGPVRISPRQVHYPVGARLRFGPEDGWSWGLFARHQSNHDADVPDAVLDRETVSYEVYGAEIARPGLRLAAGLYYDRGTTRELKPQRLPFDDYLGGVQAEASHAFGDHLYAEGALELIALRDAHHEPPHLDVNARADAGLFWQGGAAGLRLFLRFERLEDYRWLGDDPVHAVFLGTAVDTRAP